MEKERILVFTATYNEADNIEDLINKIFEYLPESDILVVDDNSPDGTGKILNQLSKENPKIKVIHRFRKLGLGTAHKLAMKYTLENDYDFLITMDADFSHNPKYLPTLIDGLRKNDFVIGSRYIEGGKCDYGFCRYSISKLANFLARFLLRIKLKETTTSFRGFNKFLLKRLPIDKIKAEGYSFFVECIYLVTKITKKYYEFPIYFEDRREGTSKISKKEIYKGATNLFRLFFNRFFKYNKNNRKKTKPHSNKFNNCNFCQHPYHMELYPSTSSIHKSERYCCTSIHHSQHGRIVQCLTCGLIYTNPQLLENKLKKIYSGIEDNTYLDNIDARFKTFKYNFEKINQYVPKKGKLLDIGSYCGVFLKVAQDNGYDVIGLEPSSWAADYTKKHFGIDVIKGTISDMPDSLKDFDIITSWDVLEHVSDPMRELRLINSKLKKGGILAFSTLNIKNWYPKLMGERWPWMMDMHLYYFDNKIIEEMLKRNNFKLLKVRKYCHIITIDYLLIKLDRLGISGIGLLRNMFFNTILKKIFIPFKFGDILLYVCEKIK